MPGLRARAITSISKAVPILIGDGKSIGISLLLASVCNCFGVAGLPNGLNDGISADDKSSADWGFFICLFGVLFGLFSLDELLRSFFLGGPPSELFLRGRPIFGKLDVDGECPFDFIIGGDGGFFTVFSSFSFFSRIDSKNLAWNVSAGIFVFRIGGESGIFVADVFMGLKRGVGGDSLLVGLNFSSGMALPLGLVFGTNALLGGTKLGIVFGGDPFNPFDAGSGGGLVVCRLASMALLFNSLTMALMSVLLHFSDII